MIRNKISVCLTLALGAWALPMLAPAPAHAQLWTWTREQMVEYTPAWTGERFADGRPKVSDGLLERARGLSSEEITINWGAAPGGGAEPAGGEAAAGEAAAPAAAAAAPTASTPTAGRFSIPPRRWWAASSPWRSCPRAPTWTQWSTPRLGERHRSPG